MPLHPRILLLLGLVLLPLGLAYFDRPGLEKATPATLAHFLSRSGIAAPTPPGSAPEQMQAVVSPSTSPADLFSVLFSPQRPATSAVLAAAKARFREPYPQPTDEHFRSPEQSEIVSRLGLLKFLESAPLRRENVELFRSVAANPREHWLVQRQAVRNLRLWLIQAPEAERLKVFASAEPRALSLAALSEDELLFSTEARNENERKPSATELPEGLLKWEQLECPSAEEFAALSARVKWQSQGNFTCDLGQQGKLGRLLHYMAKIDFGDDNSSPIAQDLRRPLEFLERNINHLTLELEQATTVAYNRPAIKKVLLGSIFFEMAPLEAMQVLIHEARHSHPAADTHEVCAHGDIPRSPGGCDEMLDDGADAKAYSYGIYFYLKLARMPSLALADREFLRSEALGIIIRRINRLPPRLAQFSDGIAAITEKGKAVFLHPFVRAALPIQGSENHAEAPMRLGFNYGTGGVLLVLKESFARAWEWGKKLTVYNEELLAKAGVQAKFIGKLNRAGEHTGYPYLAFLDQANALKIIRYDPKEGIRKIYLFPHQPEGWKIKQFVHALAPASDSTVVAFTFNYFLSEDGRIFRGLHYPGELPFQPAPWDSQGPWADIHSGILHDQLFAISQDGRLYHQVWGKVPVPIDPVYGGDGYDWKAEVQPTGFQAEEGASKYREGTQMRALLGKDGKLNLRYYSDSDVQPIVALPGEKIVDFVFFRLLSLKGAYAVQRTSNSLLPFEKKCRMKSAERDPWLDLGVGLDQNGRLIFEGPQGECFPAALPAGAQGKIRAFRFTYRDTSKEQDYFDYHKPKDDLTEFFTPLILELELADGSKLAIRPYQGWDASAERP